MKMKSNLVIVFWLYIALLPIQQVIFSYRSIRDEIVTRDWSLDAAHYAAVALVSLIAVLAVPLPVAIA